MRGSPHERGLKARTEPLKRQNHGIPLFSVPALKGWATKNTDKNYFRTSVRGSCGDNLRRQRSICFATSAGAVEPALLNEARALATPNTLYTPALSPGRTLS